mmetsp:Transcript_6191/g.15323  ORF Transcript_6191/g.15323 Transcript_6191/m.15323 type:complete len:691 (+) Transcript_6191:209-2281(+)|eukprot:CAMPEP_0197176740 /NCGR_PEP_ID=MMETSP1423-20130617/2557_1 /TAXON_ID=476441 /ORGANISM="Pseudo-nitzschia heimii, Strain UNC1101" /LENGTH=690 /DNA_ID=CAMNT_0042626151 /DNA_START=193 /DNA_END=2265 /DNA_ORIENTATION=+
MTINTLKALNHPIHEKAPIRQALHHKDTKMQSLEPTEPPSVELKVVSHVPVSIRTENRSSSSSLCTSASKIGIENVDIMFAPQLYDKLTNKLSVASADDAMDHSYSHNSAKSRSPEFITRPHKKARIISNDPSLGDSITSPRAVSPMLGQQHSSLLLLAEEGDDLHLNPLHVFVRKQIEVFAATATELAQPAPGRKQPIQMHQVGLRCIHCRNNLSKKAKVKRAVCYPSTVARIYHSVSDMKFDHFSHCRHLPPDVRQAFEALKEDGKNQSKSCISKNKVQSIFSTPQYYRESAARKGLVDGPVGIIFMNDMINQNLPYRTNKLDTITIPRESNISQISPTTINCPKQLQIAQYANLLIQQQTLNAVNAAVESSILPYQEHESSILAAKSTMVDTSQHLKHITQSTTSNTLQPLLTKLIDSAIALTKQEIEQIIQIQPQIPLKRSHESTVKSSIVIPSHGARMDSNVHVKRNIVPLSALEDAEVLNPIHCFVRNQLEFFSADEEDIAAPCPGRKSRVTLGQVGIRCKHCAKLKIPPRARAKRTVCYPPNLGGIYHSVSNMKFDHFGVCPSLPSSAREELAALRVSCGGRSQANGSNNMGGINTAQYYRISAAAMGLVDTDKGIRFNKPCTTAPASSGIICLQPSADKITNAATTPLPIHLTQPVLPEKELEHPTCRMSALMEAAARASSI